MSVPRLFINTQGDPSGSFAPPPTPDHYRHMMESPHEHADAQSSTEVPPFADSSSHQDLHTEELHEGERERGDTCDAEEARDDASSRKRRLGPLLKGDGLGRWNPALTLENTGSVARDHLASERTFLAYVRTSLTIASTGVALVQLFTISAATSNRNLEAYSRPVGAVVICVGLATLALGLTRYFMIQNALVEGHYPVARVSSLLLALVMMAVIVVVFGIIVGVQSKS